MIKLAGLAFILGSVVFGVVLDIHYTVVHANLLQRQFFVLHWEEILAMLFFLIVGVGMYTNER